MSQNRGQIIDRACQILLKTYKELNRLKDDCGSLLLERDERLRPDEEYSYGGKFLHVRANHTFLFRRPGDAPDTAGEQAALDEEELFALVCLFLEEGGLDRVSLKDEPELWAGRFTARRSSGKWRPWDVASLLRADRRSVFNEDVRCDGRVYQCRVISHDASQQIVKEYSGAFVGVPLVSIESRELLESRLVSPLFSHHASTGH